MKGADYFRRVEANSSIAFPLVELMAQNVCLLRDVPVIQNERYCARAHQLSGMKGGILKKRTCKFYIKVKSFVLVWFGFCSGTAKKY